MLEVIPVDYIIASASGTMLRDKVTTIFFAKMIHRITKTQETETTFSLSAENLTCSIENTIYIDAF